MGELTNEAEPSSSDPTGVRRDGDIWLPGEEEPHSPQMPTPYQLSRGQWFCLLTITVLLILYALYSARAIVFPITLAFLIALPLRPLVRSCRSTGLPDPIGALLVVSVLVVAVVSGCVVLCAGAPGGRAGSGQERGRTGQ